jgi:hypothetical protein
MAMTKSRRNMRIRHTVAIIGLASTVLLGILTPTDSAAAQKSIVGSWIVFVTPESTNPNIGVPPPFFNFAVNTSDRLIINSDTGGLVQMGDWIKLGDHRYGVTFRGQSLAGTVKVRATVELSHDGEAFDGPFTTDIFDPAGTLQLSISGHVHAERTQVEPLGP